MSDEIEITFTENVEVLNHNKEVEFEAKRGDVVKLNPASADRWVKRNVAVKSKVKLDKSADSKSSKKKTQDKNASKENKS